MYTHIIITPKSKDYELIDSGDSEKLERYGSVILRRPDPQALWSKALSNPSWNDYCHAVFVRDSKQAEWQINSKVPQRWAITLGGLKFWIQPTTFKHTGLFPEQLGNWELLMDQISNSSRPVKILNLFGYTGGATLAAAKAGAEVTHIDASKVAINWARDNQILSNLTDHPIRWILDDVAVFVKRELKRNKKYDGIIMDPPAFGHGPKGESWKIEKDFMPLLSNCFSLLSPNPLFVLLNGYASGYSAIAYENNLLPLKNKFGGQINKGELSIQETSAGRLLPCGIFARWFT